MGNQITKGIALFLIITLGVAAGNLLSNAIAAHIAAEAAKAELEALQKEEEHKQREARKAAELTAARLKLLDDMAKQRRTARSSSSAVEAEQPKRTPRQQQLQATCDYWTIEYHRTGSEIDKEERDRACLRAR